MALGDETHRVLHGVLPVDRLEPTRGSEQSRFLHPSSQPLAFASVFRWLVSIHTRPPAETDVGPVLRPGAAALGLRFVAGLAQPDGPGTPTGQGRLRRRYAMTCGHP
jgi:hypothetical protein